MPTAEIVESPARTLWLPDGVRHELAGAPVEKRMAGEMLGTSLDQLGSMIGSAMAQAQVNGGVLTPKQQVASLRHWVFVAVRCIRDAVLEVPLRVFDSPTPGTKGEEITAELDPTVMLLKYPNPFDSLSEFWSFTMTFLELTGNAYWLKVRDGLGVAELWPMPSQFVKPVHKSGQPLVGYSVEVGNGQQRVIPSEDILHLRYVNPQNRFCGMATLDAFSASLANHDMIKASQYAAFHNQILSNLYFNTDQQLENPVYDRLVAKLREKYMGPLNAGIPMILEGGLTPGYLNRPIAEMAYGESSKLTRDEILAAFGVPGILAGVVEDANRANTDGQIYLFQRNAIRPRLRIIQDRLNMDPEVVPDGRVAMFDDCVQADVAQEEKQWAERVTAGSVAANEFREGIGLEETPWGARPKWVWELCLTYGLPDLTPEAVAQRVKDQKDRADKMSALMETSLAANPSKAPPGKGGAAPKEGAPKEGDEPADKKKPPAESQQKTVRGFHTQTRAALIRAAAVQADQDQTALIGPTVKTLRKYFNAQKRRVKERVQSLFENQLSGSDPTRQVTMRVYLAKPGTHRLYADGSLVEFQDRDGYGVLGGIYQPPCCMGLQGEWTTVQVRQLSPDFEDGLDDWRAAATELAGRMEAKLRAGLQAGGDFQAQTLGVAARFDLNNPRAEAWLEQKQRDYWNDTVNATTKQVLSEKLADVMNEGPTLKKLMDVVDEVMEGRIKSSAETIARTEINGAYNGGQDIERTELGVSDKEWIATHDGRTRNGHYAADGQIRGQGIPFLVMGENLMYPGDPQGSLRNIVNCRCVATGIPSEDDVIAPGFEDDE
jgi:HK97 family phage portal protein